MPSITKGTDEEGWGIIDQSWLTDWSMPLYGYVSDALGGETISNCEESKLGLLSYESMDGRDCFAYRPLRGGDPGIS